MNKIYKPWYILIYLTGYKVNPVDLAPQYASVLTGLVRFGVLGATVSTAIAGTLRQKVLGTTSWKKPSHCAFEFHKHVSIFFYLKIFQNAESWQKILVITGSVHLFAVIIYTTFGSGKQQEWAQPAYEKLVTPKSERKQTTYGSTYEPFPDISSQNGSLGLHIFK